jgi:hypothetical protein
LERLTLAGRSVSTASAEKNMLGFRARASRISSLASGRGGLRYCGGQQSGLKKRLSSPTSRVRRRRPASDDRPTSGRSGTSAVRSPQSAVRSRSRRPPPAPAAPVPGRPRAAQLAAVGCGLWAALAAAAGCCGFRWGLLEVVVVVNCCWTLDVGRRRRTHERSQL